MLFFRDLGVQITPSAKIFLTNPRDQSDFGLSLDLNISAPVSCWIRRYEDGMGSMALYKTELDDNHCGIVEFDDAKSYCHIVIFVTAHQFDLFLRSMSAFGSRLQNVEVAIVLNPDFQTLRNRRVYRIEQNPLIAMSTVEAK